MTNPLTKSALCPIQVGRDRLVEALQQWVAAAAQGQGTTVLIAGEAGIGKSRMLAAVQADAARHHYSVLRGYCLEPGRVVPYAPVLDLLNAHFAAQRQAGNLSQWDNIAPILVRHFPELAGYWPDLALSPASPPAEAKRLLFHALNQAFIHESRLRPSLIMIEDLHWADDASLEFLLYLARQIQPAAIVLLLTYRDDEIHLPLRHFLAGLDRERLAHEVTLEPLSRAEVDAMIRAIFDMDRPVREEFLDTIYGLTEGNPFVVEEVLKSLIQAGDIFYADGIWDRKPVQKLHIPRSVQDAVQRRADRLSRPARALLNLAAVVGRRFDFGLLQALTGRAEWELWPLVEELLSAQLIVEQSAEEYLFRHSLTREAICANLRARERKQLHQAIAETVERLYANTERLEAHVAELGYHFFEAGQWPKALLYARRAAQQAQARYAPRLAVEHFTRALEAARQLSHWSPELYRARGLAQDTLGNFSAAQADFEAALAMAEKTGDQRMQWQVLLDLGLLFSGRDFVHAGHFLQRSHDLARAMPDPACIARSLNRLGNWYVNLEQPLEGQAHHQEALSIFERLNDQAGMAESLDLLGTASYSAGDFISGAAYFRRAVRLFDDLNNRQGMASSLAHLALRAAPLTEVPADTLAEAVADGETAVEIAREISWRSGEAEALIRLANGLAAQGEYARALDSAQSALAIAQSIEHRPWMAFAHSVLGGLYYDLLACPLAQENFETALRLAEESRSPMWTGLVAGYLALVQIAQGNLAEAEARLGSTLDHGTPLHSLGQRVIWYARAELALAQHDAHHAVQLASRLIASHPDPAPAREPGIPRVHRLLGEALSLEGRLAGAETALVTAQEAASQVGARPLLWRIQAALGRVYQKRRRHAEAEREFSAALALIDQLAAEIPHGPLREGFRQQAAISVAQPRQLSRRSLVKQQYGGLTEREREVARLIAAGKTNREIAAALVVGESTVATHVSSILGKLGLSSRTQVAAWALQKGLGKPDL